jgi:histidine ammonia-lyase
MAPLRLRPKEGLAIMNGTAVMTALACLAYDRADYLTKLTTRLTAFNVAGQRRQRAPLRRDAVCRQAARRARCRSPRWLRQDLHSDRPPRNEQRLQDRYSMRCAPHVIGVGQDALPFLRQFDREPNSTAPTTTR